MSEITRTSLVVKAMEIAASKEGSIEATIESAKKVFAVFDGTFEKDAAAQKRANTVSTGGGGGFRKGGGKGGGEKPTAENAGTFKLGGMFKGKTVAEVAGMGASEAFSQHGYKDKDGDPQPGIKYVEWMATKDGNLAEACKLHLEALKSGTATAASASASETTDKEFDFGGSGW